MKKTNENALKILENKNKFIIGVGYSYKDICSLCDLKEYSSGDSRKKQLNTFKSLFNIEEYKVGRTIMYKILSGKELTEEENDNIIADKRGTNINSHGNKSSEYGEQLIDGLLANLYLLSMEDSKDDLSSMENIDDTYFKIETNKYNLSHWLGIRNVYNFKNARENKVDFCKNLGIHLETYEFLYPKTNNAIYKAVNYILSKLQDTGHVSIRETMKILVPKFKSEEGYILDDEEIELNRDMGVLEEVYAEEYDKDIVDKIKALRGEVANKMGYKSLSKIYNNSNMEVVKKFHENLQKVVQEKLGVYNFYPKISIILNKESTLDYLLTKDYSAQELIILATDKFLKHRKDKALLDKDIINNKAALQKKIDYLRSKTGEQNPTVWYNAIQERKFYLKEMDKLTNALIDPYYKEVKVSKEIPELYIIKENKYALKEDGSIEKHYKERCITGNKGENIDVYNR